MLQRELLMSNPTCSSQVLTAFCSFGTIIFIFLHIATSSCKTWRKLSWFKTFVFLPNLVENVLVALIDPLSTCSPDWWKGKNNTNKDPKVTNAESQCSWSREYAKTDTELSPHSTKLLLPSNAKLPIYENSIKSADEFSSNIPIAFSFSWMLNSLTSSCFLSH